MGWIHDYFSFSKRERTGIIVLIILTVIVFLLPEFIPQSRRSTDAKAAAEIRRQIALLESEDTDSGNSALRIDRRQNDALIEEPVNNNFKSRMLFEFDPNTLSEDGWRKLGISERTASTIKKYLAKGGQFRKPEDIGKIYGIRRDQYERLLPYVRIYKQADENHTNSYSRSKPGAFKKSEHPSLTVININEADTSILISLPGIGSKLANRIINFRNRLGGFYSIEQVKETYGVQDSVFRKIKDFLRCDSSQVQQMNINTVDLLTLRNHPYITWNIANAIINYREQHGNYTSINDLLQIDIISPPILQKLIPYLKVN